jgi:Protein of unknown function (DUF3800)
VHRLESERLVVILTSYFDESGTHAGSPLTVMAGVMGTAAQWGRFQMALDKLKNRYGFRIFHATEFKARSGQFAGWSPQKCVALIGELADLTGNSLMHGAVLSVKNSEYAAYYRTGDTPRKLRLDTCYALSFRLCLVHMVSEVMRRLAHSKHMDRTRLNVVLESGHKHSGDAIRAFHEEMKGLEGFGCDLLAGGMTLANKDKCDPLMVADFLAHTTYMQGEAAFPPPPIDDDLLHARQKTGLTHLGFDPGGLSEYKASIVERWNAARSRPFVPRTVIDRGAE